MSEGAARRSWRSPHRCRFIIVTTPRCGSYHFASLLDSAPDVTCLGEIFKENRVELPADLRERLGIGRDMTVLRDIDPRGFLDHLMAQIDTPVFGFKEFEIRLCRVRLRNALLKSRDWRKLYLTRNPIRKYVSLQRARQSGAFTLAKGAEAAKAATPIRFDPVLFEQALAYDAKQRASLDAIRALMPDHVAAFDYRDLSDPARLAEALRFIRSEADPARLVSRYQRQNPTGLRDGIADFDLMAGYMRDNGHAALLEDALRPEA